MGQVDVLSTEEAAVELGVSADRVRALIGAGRPRRAAHPAPQPPPPGADARRAGPMKVLAVGSQKGGVSKSTTVL